MSRHNTRTSLGHEEQWDDLDPADNADMSVNDRLFCRYIMGQLDQKKNNHFTEPFRATVGTAEYQSITPRVDLKTINENLQPEIDFYQSLNHFVGHLQLIVNNCKTLYSGSNPKPRAYDKVNDLQNHLVNLFGQKKTQYARGDREAGVASSTPAGSSVPTAAPVAPAPATASPRPSNTRDLVDRYVTPALSRATDGHIVKSRETPGHRSNTGAHVNPFVADVEQAILDDGADEPVKTDAEALRQARNGKKRATSNDAVGGSSKRARQEAPKKNSSGLRIQIANAIDDAMGRVLEGSLDMELDEDAQGYANHLSQMNPCAMQKAKQAVSNEIKEDCMDAIEVTVVELIQQSLEKALIKKSHSMPRASLSSMMETSDDDEDIAKAGSRARVKKE
ncbi:hypothetical protein E4T38_06258 [Aureobasidium subglaciale]|nr:hypothetical protein E4T38_06258 [Aureobasidium subglaciale]KAI5219704.1 hypothetical protein E4T40_06284 [Aureobasidium subglaciale]KAI5223429.1 hypothetical protein E4T41_06124 [Aureobasidium subglaciale]KAI5260397.1 hypothetical protein E4T46_06013 [Aureobasidium subglaciale]